MPHLCSLSLVLLTPVLAPIRISFLLSQVLGGLVTHFISTTPALLSHGYSVILDLFKQCFNSEIDEIKREEFEEKQSGSPRESFSTDNVASSRLASLDLMGSSASGGRSGSISRLTSSSNFSRTSGNNKTTQ